MPHATCRTPHAAHLTPPVARRLKKRGLSRNLFSVLIMTDQPKGLSPKGLFNAGSSNPLLFIPLLPPPPLGGGFGGIVIMTRDMELSRITFIISGFMYFLREIFLFKVFNSKDLLIRMCYKSNFLKRTVKKIMDYLPPTYIV